MNTPNALPKTTLIWAPGTWEADAADTAARTRRRTARLV